MTTTAITFEVDGMALALPDASGLAPLTLPALPTLDAAPSQTAVDRFQAAMQENSSQQAAPQEAQPQDTATSKTAVLLMQLGTPAPLEHTSTQATVITGAPTPQTQPATTDPTVATPQNAATPAVAEPTVTTATTAAPAPEAKQTIEPTVAQATTTAATPGVTTKTALPAEPPQGIVATAPQQAPLETAPAAKNTVTPSTANTYAEQGTDTTTIPAQPVIEQAVVTPEVPVESPVVSSKAVVIDSSSGKDLKNVEEDSDSADQVTASAVAGSSSGVQIPVNAVQASPVSPVSVPAFDGVVSPSEEISGAGMTSAQIEELVETVAAQIRVERSLQAGEGTVTIQLKPAVLEGSQISLSAKDGSLSVEIAPATVSVAERIQGAVPRLEAALAGHVAEFHSFSVVLRKGRKDETA